MVDEEVLLIMKQARQCLGAANLLSKDEEYYSGAINRAYYCVFHCARALLSDKDDTIDYSKHSQVIGDFRRMFIKTGIFEKRLSDIIGDLFEDRNGCDYDERFFITTDTVESKIKDAEFFYKKVCEHLNIDA